LNYRAKLIKIVTFLGGIYFFLKFVLPEEFSLPGVGVVKLGAYNDQISAGLIALFSMALGLGLLNLVIGHGSTIIFKKKGWFDSLVLLLGLGIMLGLSILDWRASLKISGRTEEFFILKGFSERIESDFTAKTEGVLPYHVRNEKLASATRALANKTEDNLNAIKYQPGDLSTGPFASSVKELRDILQKLRESVSLLQVTDASAPSFDGNKTVGAILAEAGPKLNEVLNFQYQASTLKRTYRLFFDGLFVSLGSAMFSLLGFYIASAAYRAFRIRSAESALMMLAALLVMLGQIPFMLFGSGEVGQYLHHLFPSVRLWLLTVPNSAAFRAIEIGAAIAALIIGFRMWFSIESESFATKGTEE
jgi:hypothetical protein